ncbi:hypothetical protein CDL15_Pgr028432 [Punica granatum]|uniref:AP complex mu/sigma subunit domain-containing protein n=1 Tax=Punica granatum TaxID=22663 RepID=A0A218W4X4_PUNGR|nr:hypothetical protein CDL15_Pgr028432 [Punica granatum]
MVAVSLGTGRFARLVLWPSWSQGANMKGTATCDSALLNSADNLRGYASLYFCMCIDPEDNELEILEIIHHYVEILDRYFGSVCELDLIYNFHKAYYVLDELLIAGELQESSKKTIARLIAAQDSLVEAAKEEANSISNIIAQATK